MTRRRPAGFTLVELIITVAIIGLVSAMFMTSSVFFQRQAVVEQLQDRAQFALNMAMAHIERDALQAAGIALTAGGYTGGSNVLILQLPALGPAPGRNLIPGVYDSVIFRLADDRTGLVRAVIAAAQSSRESQTETLVEHSINRLRFTYDGHSIGTSPKDISTVGTTLSALQTNGLISVAENLTSITKFRNRYMLLTAPTPAPS